MRWLEDQDDSFRVKKVILVATNSGLISKTKKLDDRHGFFRDDGYDFAKLKTHCDEYVVLHSRDDKRVPFAHGIEISE